MKKKRNRVKVAVVDDQQSIVTTISTYLKCLKCEVSTYTDPSLCLQAVTATPVDILITDLDMPQMGGIELMGRVKDICPSTEVIVVTGSADKQKAIQALKKGAYDFFEKPVTAEDLQATVKRTMQYRAVVRERDRYADQLLHLSGKDAERWGINAFVGKSRPVRDVVAQISRLQQTSDLTALIRGESGTGKELVARAVHYGSSRVSSRFVPINCAAIPSELVESTLFGHVKGAFTGAVADRKGALVLADKGTLFLDEMGDMPKAMQAKLLRVLEDGLVTPVGSTNEQKVNVRILAATNTDLEEKVACGQFREDLYFRLSVYTLTLPPLRERAGDIPLLVRHFTEALASNMGRAVPELSSEAMNMLKEHNYPGNVRELRNVIHRALVECDGAEIRPEHIQFVALRREGVSQKTVTSSPKRNVNSLPINEMTLNMAEAEAILISRALAQADGNMSAAARLLGINRPKLYRKLTALGDLAP